MNKWWLNDPRERLWLEATDREDLGANLHAPQYGESGESYWGYDLVREVEPGDIVLHYHKKPNPPAIVAASIVSSTAREEEIVWAARGTAAREKDLAPYRRPGILAELSDLKHLGNPVTLENLREAEPQIRQLKEGLQSAVDGALYFPFALSEKRPLRPSQGYLFKLPVDFLKIFPSLAIAINARQGAPIQQEQEAASKAAQTTRDGTSSASGGQGFSMSADYREAIEKRSMEAAREHFEDQGYMLRDTSANKPYDYVATRGLEQLYIEVKGTTGTAEEVILTKNEVLHAQDPRNRCVLFILHSIVVKEGANVSDGERKVVRPWVPKDAYLTPISYWYQLK